MDRVLDDNYIPTPTDVLRARVRTNGIIETNFRVNDTIIRYYKTLKDTNDFKIVSNNLYVSFRIMYVNTQIDMHHSESVFTDYYYACIFCDFFRFVVCMTLVDRDLSVENGYIVLKMYEPCSLWSRSAAMI